MTLAFLYEETKEGKYEKCVQNNILRIRLNKILLKPHNKCF